MMCPKAEMFIWMLNSAILDAIQTTVGEKDKNFTLEQLYNEYEVDVNAELESLDKRYAKRKLEIFENAMLHELRNHELSLLDKRYDVAKDNIIRWSKHRHELIEDSIRVVAMNLYLLDAFPNRNERRAKSDEIWKYVETKHKIGTAEAIKLFSDIARFVAYQKRV